LYVFKQSLNVAVAFGIVAYQLRYGAPYQAQEF